MGSVVVLTKAKHFEFVRSVLPTAETVETLDKHRSGLCLISFYTGLIVAPVILDGYGRKYNFHPGSPSYPGRDPHHWACLNGANEFGATAHLLTRLVDHGEIVGTLTVGVPKDSSPEQYRAISDRAVRALFSTLAPIMASEGTPAICRKWVGEKHTRADLLKICQAMSGMPPDRAEPYRRAFAGFEQHFR